MSTDTTFKIVCSNSDATEKFGTQLGRNLKGGEVIELISDLGGGKTTLVRGIAGGAGSHDIVSSPSFTISKIYKTKTFDIHHFDFYRLSEAGLMEHSLADVLSEPTNVVLVEWGGIVEHVLPKMRFTINITKTSDNTREIVCSYPDQLAYLVGKA